MIMANRLDRGFYKYQEAFEKKAIEVLRSGWYILGKEVEEFEKEFAGYIGSKFCAGVASGLDALYLAFRAVGIKEGFFFRTWMEWILRSSRFPSP